MNDFNAKYIKLSSKYLQEKLNTLKTKEEGIYNLPKKKEVSLKNLVSSIFKS